MGMSTVVFLTVYVPHHLGRPASDLASFVVMYVGPDQMLPIASALGAVFGVLLIVWNRAVSLVRRAFRFLMRKPTPEPISREELPPTGDSPH